MFLLVGVLPIALVVVVVLHFVVFKHDKPFWINWVALFAVSGGLIALLGAGSLHAGLIGLLTLIIGFFWLSIMDRKDESINASSSDEAPPTYTPPPPKPSDNDSIICLRHCPKCGKEYDGSWEVCSHCNAKLSISNIKKQLDSAVLSIAKTITVDIYDNIIDTTVCDWFEGNESISMLSENIKNNVSTRWPYLEKKIKNQLSDFEEQTKTSLLKGDKLKEQKIDSQAISMAVSQGITIVLASLATVLSAIVCGGAGMALIAGGPVGWLMGGIIGVFAFVLGKNKAEEAISKLIVNRKIPAIIKRAAKKKIAAQLKLNQSKFEQEIYDLLQKQLKPIYEAIDQAGDSDALKEDAPR